jgi:hypothetical protein
VRRREDAVFIRIYAPLVAHYAVAAARVALAASSCAAGKFFFWIGVAIPAVALWPVALVAASAVEFGLFCLHGLFSINV